MGIFAAHVTVANPRERSRQREIEAIIDTGSTLTKLPDDLLQDLGIKSDFSVPSITSDNREIQRPVGQAWIAVNGRAGIVPVAFGERGAPVLLGATALEILGFAVDPVEQKLLPRALREK